MTCPCTSGFAAPVKAIIRVPKRRPQWINAPVHPKASFESRGSWCRPATTRSVRPGGYRADMGLGREPGILAVKIRARRADAASRHRRRAYRRALLRTAVERGAWGNARIPLDLQGTPPKLRNVSRHEDVQG
jgi:hypothetical protein